jgi:hypothetical protein
MKTCVVLLLALTVLASCATHQPPAASEEFLDEESANTLLVVATPLVFARDRSDVAAHARDYATLVTVEVDHSGDYTQYLLLYRWSTVDRRMAPLPGPDAGALRIVADGRAIDLEPLARMPVNILKRRQLHVPQHDDVVLRGYKIDPASLDFIATSRQLKLRMPQESLATPFTLWEDGRNALQQFLLRAAPR